ncbi:hypothetical protein GQ457_11G024890 [Hibiscus cannabinus]
MTSSQLPFSPNSGNDFRSSRRTRGLHAPSKMISGHHVVNHPRTGLVFAPNQSVLLAVETDRLLNLAPSDLLSLVNRLLPIICTPSLFVALEGRHTYCIYVGRDFTLGLKIQSRRFKKKSSCDFSPGTLCSALSPGSGNEGVRFLHLTIRSRRLGDQLVREFVSS